MTVPFLEYLEVEIDTWGQAVAERIAPAIIERITEATDEWHKEELAAGDGWLQDVGGDWHEKVRSAILWKVLKHLRAELEKVESMHCDLVWTTLQRQYEEGA